MPEVLGPTRWSGGQTDIKTRSYQITFLVKTLKTEGPYTALTAPGLPFIGSAWSFDDDYDGWVFYTGEASIEPRVEREPNTYWDVTLTFSNKNDETGGCNEAQIENPLLEPQKVSGSFTKFTREAQYDKNGNFIHYSSWEPVTGPDAEFDDSRPTVRIEQNVADLQLPLITSMRDTINNVSMWGLNQYTVKLSNISWEKKFYGLCFPYYTRTFEFEVNFNGWDRDVVDQGQRLLNGKWNDSGYWETIDIPGIGAPDSNNPAHFVRAKDREGNPTTFILNGAGEPYDPDSPNTAQQTQGTITIAYYGESNFFLLGIPALL